MSSKSIFHCDSCDGEFENTGSAYVCKKCGLVSKEPVYGSHIPYGEKRTSNKINSGYQSNRTIIKGNKRLSKPQNYKEDVENNLNKAKFLIKRVYEYFRVRKGIANFSKISKETIFRDYKRVYLMFKERDVHRAYRGYEKMVPYLIFLEARLYNNPLTIHDFEELFEALALGQFHRRMYIGTKPENLREDIEKILPKYSYKSTNGIEQRKKTILSIIEFKLSQYKAQFNLGMELKILSEEFLDEYFPNKFAGSNDKIAVIMFIMVCFYLNIKNPGVMRILKDFGVRYDVVTNEFKGWVEDENREYEGIENSRNVIKELITQNIAFASPASVIKRLRDILDH